MSSNAAVLSLPFLQWSHQLLKGMALQAWKTNLLYWHIEAPGKIFLLLITRPQSFPQQIHLLCEISGSRQNCRRHNGWLKSHPCVTNATKRILDIFASTLVACSMRFGPHIKPRCSSLKPRVLTYMTYRSCSSHPIMNSIN